MSSETPNPSFSTKKPFLWIGVLVLVDEAFCLFLGDLEGCSWTNTGDVKPDKEKGPHFILSMTDLGNKHNGTDQFENKAIELANDSDPADKDFEKIAQKAGKEFVSTEQAKAWLHRLPERIFQNTWKSKFEMNHCDIFEAANNFKNRHLDKNDNGEVERVRGIDVLQIEDKYPYTTAFAGNYGPTMHLNAQPKAHFGIHNFGDLFSFLKDFNEKDPIDQDAPGFPQFVWTQTTKRIPPNINEPGRHIAVEAPRDRAPKEPGTGDKIVGNLTDS